MQNRMAFGVITVASASAGLLLIASPALAQTADDFEPNCATGVLAYAPGITSGAASDSTPEAGTTITVTSGAGTFDIGSTVTVSVRGVRVTPDSIADGDRNATATITVPDGSVGTFVVLFKGTLAGSPNVVGVCFEVATPIAGVGGGAGQPVPPAGQPVGRPVTPIVGDGGGPTRPSALPFTGSVELLAVAGLGAALVTVGAGTVVVARRRRHGDSVTA